MFHSSRLVLIAFLMLPLEAYRVRAATDELSPEAKAAMEHLSAERQDLPEWVRSGQLPFSFQYGGKSSADLLPHWKKSICDNGREGNKHQYVITYRDDATQLEVTVDLTLFADFPAADWVLRFKNAGKVDTPILENVFPLDHHLSPPDDVVLHYAQGSTANGLVDANKSTGYDFQPYDKKLNPNDAHHFVSFLPTSWANSSEQWLPFFNLQWNGGGVAWAVGWSGRWKMDVVRDAGNAVLLRAGQNTLRTKLQPGESIRTPRMVLLFWQGNDAMQGHNPWRQLLIAHYLPRYDGQLQMTPVAASNFDATGNGGPAMNEASCLAWIKTAKQFGAEVFWLDACWFQPTAWGTDDRFGTWDPDPIRFPKGLKVVADVAHANGMKFLVWFMEHAVREGTDLAKTHPEWIVNGCWDFANPNAAEWLTDYMKTRLRAGGIDFYRHDGGLGCTAAHDTDDRQGITENHAIEGWYTYWDALRHMVPGGLPLDNCAGGGTNIDLETMTRSLPYWRTDACTRPNPDEHPSSETYHQVQTAGLNLYIPLHAGGVWHADGNSYRFRSMTTTGVVFADDLASPQFNLARAKENVEELKSLRELWLGDYYPLTEIGVDETKWCGWQFHRADLDKGCVTLFRRPKCEIASMDPKLRGIAMEQRYRVRFVDTKQEMTMTGQELSRLHVDIPTMPGSVLVVYERQAETKNAWQLGDPIVSYWAGPGYDGVTGPLTDAAAKQMADVGINLVWAGSLKELDIAKRYGLRAFYVDRSILDPGSLDKPDLRSKLDALVDSVRGHSALYSYHIIDEPSSKLFDSLARLVAYLRQRDPAHVAYIDLFPNYADPAGCLATASHDEYLTRFISTVKPGLLSYDHYQFGTNNDTGKYLENLEAVGQKSKLTGIPFMNIVQAASWTNGGVRIPTPDQERYLAYTTLAYGAQGISYYVWCYPGHEGGIVQPDGKPSAIYDVLKATNREFVKVAKQSQSLKWIGAYLKGYRADHLPLGTALLPGTSPFDIVAVPNDATYNNGEPLKGVLFGLFGKDGAAPADATVALVVNLDYAVGKTYTVTGPDNLSIFNATTGAWTPTGSRQASLNLVPGGGILIGQTSAIHNAAEKDK